MRELLIIGSYNEPPAHPVFEPQLGDLGYRTAGRGETPNPDRRGAPSYVLDGP